MVKQTEVMYDSPEAARKVEMVADGNVISSGWLSIDNYFYNTEDMARYKSATHRICECGNKMQKHYTKCERCRDQLRLERYRQMPFEEWDGSKILYCNASDKYFKSSDDIDDFLEESELTPEDLQLVICEENNYAFINSDYWEDVLAEDGEINEKLMKKVDELNEFIKTLPPASYSTGKKRTSYQPK